MDTLLAAHLAVPGKYYIKQPVAANAYPFLEGGGALKLRHILRHSRIPAGLGQAASGAPLLADVGSQHTLAVIRLLHGLIVADLRLLFLEHELA